MSAAVIVRRCIEEVPDALAAGIIDLSIGMLVGVEFSHAPPEEIIDFLAPATKQLFDAPLLLELQRHLERYWDLEPREHSVDEVLIASAHFWHYFGRMAHDPKVAVAIVTRGKVNIGLLLARARAITRSASVWT
jgi:hypothetical protein